jgi:tripartite-type tricarboxylate transporter receptor subunit TctC
VHCSFDPTDCSSAEQAQGRCNDSTGAGTNLAAQSVINAPPDGHTLLFVTPVNAINATLYSGLPFDFMRDVAAVAGIVTVPFVLQVTPSFPANNVAELIAYAKANPGKISMASAGIGSVPHMAGELFKLMAGVRPWLCENVLPPMIPAV